jgi:hypothetical protein
MANEKVIGSGSQGLGALTPLPITYLYVARGFVFFSSSNKRQYLALSLFSRYSSSPLRRAPVKAHSWHNKSRVRDPRDSCR